MNKLMFPTPYTVDFSARDTDEDTHRLFVERWSPRSFKKTDIPEAVLRTIFDAARWSPSSYNEQPWLFVTNTGSEDFDLFCSLLIEVNQAWARNASLLGFIVANKYLQRDNQINKVARFDCGSAWMAMTLQARLLGLYTHGMGGIKRDEVYPALNIDPKKYEVICGFAVGVIDKPADPAQESPSPRKPLAEIWHRGKF